MWIERQGGSDFGQLALRRLFLSAPEHASGCPKPRLGSACQLGRAGRPYRACFPRLAEAGQGSGQPGA
eukprot:scaffold51404_cov57-Phaeocystis_antarctica.AAC.1